MIKQSDAPLTATEKAALLYIVASPHEQLHRAPGGYWTWSGSAPDHDAWGRREWVGTRTIQALKARGLLHHPMDNMVRFTDAGKRVAWDLRRSATPRRLDEPPSAG